MAVLTEDELIKIRRHLHEIPELALQEKETHAYLLEVIQNFKQDYLTIKTPESLPTALLVLVKGKDPKRTIGYRTDIDALPVTEKTGLPFSSKTPGIMHACGHDIHMSVAIGLLSYFSEQQPKDNLLFFFQPDEFYGLHDNPALPAGSIGCRMGTLFAGTTEINIDLFGKGGHAAFPQNANDTVVAAASLIMQIQTIISRSIDPIQSGVITLGKVEAGTIRNVIAGHTRIEGTLRGLTQEMILKIDQRLRDLCEGIARSYNMQVKLDLNQGGYWPVENDPKLTQNFISYMKENKDVNYIETEPKMTGEDFGFLLAKFPGTMFWLGVGDPDSELHSATLNPDEKSIQRGVDAIKGFLISRMEK